MHLSARIDNNACLISLDGELDAFSSILVDQALEDMCGREQKFILVDFTLLTYISAAGIGAFIYHIKKMQDCGKLIIFHSMSPSIHHIFAVTGLEEILPIVACREEAKMLCRHKTCN